MIRAAGERLGQAVLDGIGRIAGRFQEHRSLPVDLLESDDAYLAVFDAPGATAEDVSIRFRENTLSVSVDRFREFRDGYELRFPGRGLDLAGEIELPAEAVVDADAADATLTQAGTLEVLLPKAKAGSETETETETGSSE